VTITKLGRFFVAVVLVTICISATAITPRSGDQKKASKGSAKAEVVDAGSFGIFVNGKRVGTETFHIEQSPDVSIATSTIKVDEGATKAEQSSEMRIEPNGNLRSYTWHSTIPIKEESIVEPNEEFLVEHITFADQRKQNVPYLLPLATVILDDNFFSHREILLWRYLASGCDWKDNQLHCGKTAFGVLCPRQHVSGNAIVELAGREKIMVKGVQKELNKVKLDSDGVQWLLWITDEDDRYKVMKMAVPASNVEIIRD
jgi:hypothetical protein